VAGAAVAVAGLAVCVRRARLDVTEQQLPLAGLAAAFFLVLGVPIIPVAVGTDGHLLGGTLAVALLGPWLGPVVITVVTVVQALFLGDGGLSTLGLQRLLRTIRLTGPAGTTVAAGVAAAVSVLAAAVLFTAEYAVGGVAGVPLHTVAVSIIGVYALVAVVEGLVTALVVRGLLAVRADLVQVAT
jgi:cobalt/nickel transport system permease protein